MSPAAKFNTMVASVTVLLMFWVIAYAAPALKEAGVTSPVVLSLGALVSSSGIYRLLTLGVAHLMSRWDCARRFVLGAHYMHGTWIGYFIGHAQDKRYMVEHFSQDLDSLEISGRSFTDAGREHGYWTSESVTIDARKGKLVFTYSFDVITRSSSLAGVHTSLFERKSANDAPTGISGFAHDLNDSVRVTVHSEKASEKLLPWKEALELAKKRFSSIQAA